MGHQEKTYLLSPQSELTTEPVLLWVQLLFTSIIMIPSIVGGMSVSFAAIASPKLDLSTVYSTWFTSMPIFSSIISVLLTGMLLDKYGRKPALLFTSTTSFIGFLLIYVGSSSLTYLLLGQFLCGLAQGSMTVPPCIYITESIAPDNLKIRNSLSSWIVLAVNMGVCLDFFLGPFLSYTEVALFAIILAGISFVTISIFVPESPAWLCEKGNHIGATIARQRLSLESSKSDLDTSILPETISESYNFWTYVQKIHRKDVYKPLLLMTFLFFFVEFSGQFIFASHLVEISTVSYVQVDAYYLTIISAVAIILSQILYIVEVPLMGIKNITIISACGVGIFCFILGVTANLNQTPNSYSTIIDYVHIFSVWLINLSSGIVTTTPFTLLGEVLPADLKGFYTIPSALNNLFWFTILWIFSYSLQLSKYYIYYFFTIMNVILGVYVHYFIPETVGRTLNEINNHFS